VAEHGGIGRPRPVMGVPPAGGPDEARGLCGGTKKRALAFALLIGAECALVVVLPGQSAGVWLAAGHAPSGPRAGGTG
jgi:hypothetical protein